MGKSSGGGSGRKPAARLSHLIGFVSLVCFVLAAAYILTASGNCDRIFRIVQVFIDIPAYALLWVLQPWAEGHQFYWRIQDYMIDSRLLVADILTRQFHGYSGFLAMCRPDAPQQ